VSFDLLKTYVLSCKSKTNVSLKAVSVTVISL